MHEHVFIQTIIKDIDNKENVIGIVLEVGELAGIEASHLASHIKQETNWNVEALQKDAIIKCECGYQGSPKIRERLHDVVIFECPKCGQIPEVLEGKDIKIMNVAYNNVSSSSGKNN